MKMSSTHCDDNAFRLCVELHSPIDEPSKYLILVNKHDFLEISDLICHIKKVFKLVHDVKLYINDCLLPEGESINLIQKDDTLIVKLVEDKKRIKKKKSHLIESEINDDTLCHIDESSKLESDLLTDVQSETGSKKKESKKRKSRKSIDFNYQEQITSCLEELEKKRDELKASEIDEDNELIKGCDNTDSCCNDFAIPPKKKRKRKHKRKTNMNGNKSEISPTLISSDRYDNSDESSIRSNFATPGHKRFNEEELDSEEMESETPVNGVTTDELHKQTSNSADKSKSVGLDFEKNKIEDMNCDVTPEKRHDTCNNGESSTSINKPEYGQTILFTKIKIGENYCPEPSKEIIGKIIKVKEENNSTVVVLHILKGSDEFRVPNGKFSIEEENEVNDTPKIFSVEMNWNEIIKPRLYPF